MKQWWELSFHVSEEASEALAELLIQRGAWGLATEDPFEFARILQGPDPTQFVDPSFLEGLPDYVKIRAYFGEEAEGVRLLPCLAEDENPFYALERRLYDQFEMSEYMSAEDLPALGQALLEQVGTYLPLGKAEVHCRPIQEEDWAHHWKSYYQPIVISDRLVICPSWIPYEAKEGQLRIALDPGMAFGTGSHETTALCLRLLPTYLPQGEAVLDLGCGSGILGIAAAGLGATFVDALDIDPDAVRTTEDNARINGVADRLKASVGSLDSRPWPDYPLVVANLLAEVLVMLEGELEVAVSPGGYLLCSGIVATKTPLIDEAFRSTAWAMVEEVRDNDWVARVYRRKAEEDKA